MKFLCNQDKWEKKKEKKNTTDHVFCNIDPEARVKILVPPLQSRETRIAQTTEKAIFSHK